MVDAHYGVIAPHSAQGPSARPPASSSTLRLPNFFIHEIFDEFNEPWEKEIVTHPVEVVDGYIAIPDRPGSASTSTSMRSCSTPTSRRMPATVQARLGEAADDARRVTRRPRTGSVSDRIADTASPVGYDNCYPNPEYRPYLEGKRMLKSVAVVVGSYVLSVVLVLATDPILSRMFPGDFVRGHIPSDTALIASTVLFVLVSILCAWLCARFAPGRACTACALVLCRRRGNGHRRDHSNWNKGWPHWYWLSWLLTWPISCYVGLLLAGRRAEHERSPGPTPKLAQAAGWPSAWSIF